MRLRAGVFIAVACGGERGQEPPVAGGDRVTLSLAVVDSVGYRTALYAIEEGIVTSDSIDVAITYLSPSALAESARSKQYDIVDVPAIAVPPGPAGDFAFGVTAPDKGRPPRCVIERRAGSSRLTAGNVSVAGCSEPAGYTLEIAMPWRDLGVPPPRHNTVMGFTLLVNDSDGAGRKWARWKPGSSMGKGPHQPI